MTHNNIPLISWGWSEGRLWDNWMLVHFLSGATVASVLVLAGATVSYAWIITLALLTLWEFAEIAFGIKEEVENLVLDIVAGMLGFFVFMEFVEPRVPFDMFGEVALIFLAATTFLSLCGWWAYKKRPTK